MADPLPTPTRTSRRSRSSSSAAERVAERFFYDAGAAEKAVKFFSLFLCHTTGQWAGKPFDLLDWQAAIIRNLFGWKERATGLRRYRQCYIEVPRKNGKALAVDTPVATTSGWKRHGDLIPGDRVFGRDGAPKLVRAVTAQYRGEGYRLTFSDGCEIVAHDNHEWDTSRKWYTGRRRGSRKPLPLVTTARIAETLRQTGRGDLVHGIVAAPGLVMPDADLPVPPYTLGAWLGDGHSAAARLTCADLEIVERIAAEGITIEGRGEISYVLGRTHRRGSRQPATSSLQAKLRALGVLGNKHIPMRYLRASEDQRRALLAGLIDTDGHVTEAGQCEIAITREPLADGIVELARTLGYKPSLVIDKAKLNGRVIGPRYRIQFWPRPGDGVVSVRRKVANLRAAGARKPRSSTRMIVAAEPVKGATVNCIEVEGGFYLAGESLIPTHNSTLSAGIALLLLVADGEPGGRVVSAAADREQARIVFDDACNMVRASRLSEFCEITQRAIVCMALGANYRPLSADAFTKHGANLSGIIFDELHTQRNRELYDTLHTATGARQQPLEVMITTAGWDRNSICWQMHSYAEQVRDGIIEDPHFLPVIYGAPVDADWMAEETWRLANPSLGHTVPVDYLRKEAQRARDWPAYENAFRQLHLCQWVEQSARWLPMHLWDASGGPVGWKDLAASLKDRPCFVGCDLSSTGDLTALDFIFPPDHEGSPWAVIPLYFIPAEGVRERARKDRVPYDTWLRDGAIQTTPGNSVDYRFIHAELCRMAGQFKIQQVCYDPWNARQFAHMAQDEGGFSVVEVRQGIPSLGEPTALLEKLVRDGLIHHGGHPVLRWNAANVAIRMDDKGNIMPAKDKSGDRIDGVSALVTGLRMAAPLKRDLPVIHRADRLVFA